MRNNFDSIVVGGGPAGIGAAFAGAAPGKRTRLIERGGFLGGVATQCGLGLLINRKAHDRCDVAGRVYQEIIQRMQQRPRTWYRTGGGACDVADTEQYKIVLDQMARARGISVLYHGWVCGVLKDDAAAVSGVRVVTREGKLEVRAPLCMDATGDAAVAAMAGCEMQQIAMPQPMTAAVRLSNVDVAKTHRIIGEHTLTEDDALAMREWDDAISACAYAIDVHNATDSSTRLVEIHTRGKGAYTIPFRACVPRGFKGLLVAGRCISADTSAAGSFRVMSSCMSIGEGVVTYALTGTSTALYGYKGLP